MRNQGILPWQRRVVAVAAMLAMLLVPSMAMAANNQGTGDVAGVGADLADSNVFTLNSTTLALFKRAFANGAALTSGDSVPKGTEVKFMIYVNNDTAIGVNDLTIQDVLTGFTYSSPSIKVDNTQSCLATACTAAEELTIFGVVDATTALIDDPGDDVASYDGTDTIDVGNGNELTNAPVNIAANKVYAVLITATVD